MNFNKKGFPEFKFDEFFTGKVEAKGHLIKYFLNKEIRDLYISFEGKKNKECLLIQENYFEQELKILREWKFVKVSDNRFVGKEKNVDGDILVNIDKNALLMEYVYNLTYKKYIIKVQVKDRMFLINKNEIINHTIISKFKLKLAETFLLYKKKS